MSFHVARYGRALSIAVVVGSTARTLPAQALADASVRSGPQYMSYEVGGPIDRTFTQLTLPFAVVMPVASRLTLDIATAYASSHVRGSASSSVSGLADTQLRANYTFGNDAIIVTAGLNLPTGRSTVSETEVDAAGVIGNDFFAFPISNMGTGFGGTGGVAVARPFGGWNVGAGLSLRYSAVYTPFDIAGTKTRYQPGQEYRARVGADRSVGAGRVAIGFTYSAFGSDRAGSFTYGTGDRYVVQTGYSVPVRGVDLALSAWNLYHASGETAAGTTAPWENVANVAFAAGVHIGGATVEPNLEWRAWNEDADAGARRLGTLASVGLRTRLTIGPVTVTPGGSYSTGSLHVDGSDNADLRGWRVATTLRLGR
jgi:hypothetical protein